MHTPGLVVAPAPADAKGLLIAAIRDNNPVIYFESKPRTDDEGRPRRGLRTAGANRARRGDALSVIIRRSCGA